MFNDEGLGAAMGQYAVEKKADDLEKRLAIAEGRLNLLLQALSETLAPDQLNYLSREWFR